MTDVLVVGAGPVGLTAALTLVRAGCAVDLVEEQQELRSASLAATFHSPTLAILAGLGIDLTGSGIPAGTIGYRDETGETVLRLDLSELSDCTAYPYRRHVPQSTVSGLMLDALRADPACRIRFGTRADRAMTRGYGWVFAADGADSPLRAAAGVEFPGEPYAGAVIRLLCEPGDFEDFDPVTYVFARDTSVSVLRMADHVRVIVRTEEDLADPCSAAVRTALRVTGVRPRVRSFSLYRSQRRVIAANLVDNLVFVGDSAHVTTTRGGMNMNCGIHDAAVLATALARGRLAEAAAERLRVARDMLLPRTHETLDEPAVRLGRVLALRDDAPARREFLRRGAMLDMVTWP